LGHAMKPLRRNTRGCTGCGRCNFGCPHGAKLSVDVTYLPRALRAGARLVSNVRVERIVRRADRAAGVVGRFSARPEESGAAWGEGPARGRVRVRARRVVVAAGAYGSPLLLARSGVGKRSRQVGRNLTLHPAFRVMARFSSAVRG